MNSTKTCSIDGCQKLAIRRGWCYMHYYRWRLYGDPLKLKTRARGTGHVDKNGYIHITRKGKSVLLHRVIMEEALGRPLLPDETVHHIDQDTSNNDLSNLRVMPHGEHTVLHRTGNLWETCKRGHKWDEQIPYMDKGRRACRICRNDGARQRREKNREKDRVYQREYARRWREKNPERYRATQEEYNRRRRVSSQRDY